MQKVACIVVIILLTSCARPSSWISISAARGDISELRNSLNMGYEINRVDRSGFAPLHWAIYKRQAHAALWLIENGADVNIKTKSSAKGFPKGTTPLMIAVRLGASTEVKALISKGCDLKLENSYGMTAFDYAVKFNMGEYSSILR